MYSNPKKSNQMKAYRMNRTQGIFDKKSRCAFNCGKLLLAGIAIFGFLCSEANETRQFKDVKTGEMPFMRVVSGDSISLFWKPPVDVSDSVLSYELFYTTQSQKGLTWLQSNIPPSNNPSVTIYRKDINTSDSLFVFCVRAVKKSGLKSDFHYSTDSNATSSGGWYFFWK